MSLVVTSSAEHDETNQVGIAIPYQYRNNIKNPLMIPPNSEVAVESVKIQRVPMLDYGNNITTNFWFGERLSTSASYEDQTVYFIPARNEILGSKSPQDFADEFKVVLQETYSLHPEINSVGIEVNISTDTNGGFEGFQFKIPQIAAAAANTVPPSSTFLQEISGVDGDWDGTTLSANDDDCFLQLLPQGDQGGPLSFFNGSITYADPGQSPCIVGISRPYCTDQDGDIQGWDGRDMREAGPNTDHPFSLSQSGNGRGQYGDIFMDYCVEDDGTDIRIYNYTTEDGGAIGKMSEVIYYSNTDSANSASNADNSSFATGTPIPSASMGTVSFEIENEKVQISVSGNVVAAVNTFNSASFKSQVPMPTSISNWKMYPTVYFFADGDTVDITNYACRTSSTIYNNFPENSWITRSKIPVFIDGRGNTQTQASVAGNKDIQRTPEWNNAVDWDINVYSRAIFVEMSVGGDQSTDTTIRNYAGIQNNLMGTSGNRYENIFIMGKNNRYMESRVELWQPNSTQVLGFTPFSINNDSGITHSGGYHGASFTSITKPSLTSQQSTFIRVPTLTHETYNFATGNPSKILFQIPRFDNSGAETGALYFQNNDKSFIDLKNAAPLRITDLDVHLVRKDERFAKDLTGSTEVVFMIRPKGKL